MKSNFFKSLMPLTVAILILNACKKDDATVVPPGPVQISPAVGEYVLSEGTFGGGNNTRLSYHTNSTGVTVGDFFLQQNPTITGGLGDTGNDMIIYGSKLYIVINNSNVVTVLNANNATFLKNISFLNGAVPKFPRYAAAAKGKVYVSNSDGTVSMIDTSSLSITANIPVGSNPEQLAVSGDKLFVTNSGGFNFPNYDSTVSVINLLTNTAGARIRVGLNPRRIAADNAGNLYVVASGNYSSVPAKIVKISAASESVLFSADTAVNTIAWHNNKLYVTNDFAYTGLSSKVRVLSPADFHNLSGSFITDGTVIQTPYGLDVNEENNDIYITDARDYTSSGMVFCFDQTGKKKFSFSVNPGVNPNKVLFKR